MELVTRRENRRVRWTRYSISATSKPMLTQIAASRMIWPQATLRDRIALAL